MEGWKSELDGRLAITNTFLSCNVKGVEDLPLNEMARKISNARYNQKRCPALIIRKTNPHATILLFRTERVLIITSAAEQHLPLLVKKLQRDWQKILNTKSLKLTNLAVHNMVANFQVGFKIDLGKLCELGKGLKHDTLNGVIIKMSPIPGNVKSVIVYGSGKVGMMGGTSTVENERAYANLLKELPLYRWNPRNYLEHS